MTLVAGAVTAWGTKGGMPGPFVGLRETARGLGVALLVALAMVPVQRWVTQPAMLHALRNAADPQWTRLQIPASLHEWFYLALWSAGFQTLFCAAAPTCLAARLTGRVWPAFVLTAVLGWHVASRQLSAYHVQSGSEALLAASAARGVLGALIYARFGLIPAALLSVGNCLHLLWDILGGPS
jgi:hypothetical protein